MAPMNAIQSPPIFSIITVTLNDRNGLSQTYESIKMQNYIDYEWIVIDGASTDGTMDYLKSLQLTRAKWISEKDSGIYDAMNKGIKESSGKYIVFMNAGDIFSSENVLQNVFTVISCSAQTIDVVFGGATLKFPNGGTSFRPARNIDLYIWNGLPAIHQATYYRRERLTSCLYDLKYRICGDYYLISRLFMQGISSEYLDCSLVDFSVGDTSYRNPITVLIEGYKIQRDVLDSPIHIRLLSFARRTIAFAAWKVLSQPLSVWLFRLISKNRFLPNSHKQQLKNNGIING